MFGVRFVIKLVKLPTSEPSEVWLLATVGFCEVLQQTPRAVTLAPPLSETWPVHEAEVESISVMLPVKTVGTMALTVTVAEAVPLQP